MINFPSNPTIGQQHTYQNKAWSWTGVAWTKIDQLPKSAYDIAVDEGFVGTPEQWVDSLVGTNGTNGTNGLNGESSYDIWLGLGNTGTETEFISSIASDRALASAIGITGSAANLGSFTSPLIDDNSTAKAAIESIGTNLALSTGAARIGTIQAGTGAVSRTAQDKLRDTISVKDFGAIGNPAIADDTVSIQAALDYAGTLVSVDTTWNANASVEVVLPGKAYRISATVKVPNNVSFIGEGREVSTLVTSNDIVMIESKANVNSSASNVSMVGMKLVKERTTSTTYHIVINNPTLCTFRDIYTYTKLDDTSPNPANFGGIKLARAGTWTGSNFINRIHDCFIQNGGVLIDDITDGEITDCYIYGHSVNHAVKFLGISGNWNIAGNNFTSPQSNAAVWLASANGSNFRISGNFFDGLVPELKKGHGILSNAVQSVLVVGNHFTHQLSGIRAIQPYFWTIVGNHYRNCNNKDVGATPGSWPDLDIIGLSGYNTVTGNTHQQTDSRSPNQGYAISETTNGSGSASNSTYSSNAFFGVSGGYAQNPNGYGPIDVSGINCRAVANSGYNLENLLNTQINGNLMVGTTTTPEQAGNGQVAIGDDALIIRTKAILNSTAFVDLTVNTSEYGGEPGAFNGFLTVSQTRLDFPIQSTRTLFGAQGYGSTGNFTSLSTQNGSDGPAAFTVSMASDGVIRVTNNAAQPVQTTVAFIGIKSLA